MYSSDTDDVYSLSPATFLTKICIVSSASAEEAREDVDDIEEMLLERMVMGVEKSVVFDAWY